MLNYVLQSKVHSKSNIKYKKWSTIVYSESRILLSITNVFCISPSIESFSDIFCSSKHSIRFTTVCCIRKNRETRQFGAADSTPGMCCFQANESHFSDTLQQ